MRVLQPAARMISLVLCVATLAAMPVPAAATADLDVLRGEARSLVNRARRDQGLPPLEFSDVLNRAAQGHAEDMLRRGYYGHASPEGNTVQDRFRGLGGSRWSLVAENIAECRGCAVPPTETRVRDFQRGWMDSPPHRANILRRGLDRFGFGIVAGADGRVLAVQTFSGPGSPRGSELERGPELTPGELSAEAVRILNAERADKGAEPLRASPDLDAAAAHLLAPAAGGTLSGPGGGLALPEGFDARRWRSLQALSGTCGGCGTGTTAADVRWFVGRWLESGEYREALLAASAGAFGFAMQAGGEGRKTAIAVIGTARR